MIISTELIEKHGFVKINNSMWKKDNITLQNKYTHKGNNIYERILNTKKVLRACVNGKFTQFIETDTEFYQFINKEVKL